MSVLVVIPARYGSTRFPGKPLALLSGKPVIQRVYEQASRATLAKPVIVATDDDRIARAVTQCGGQAVMTSASARSGTERVAEVARAHQAQVIINVQGDEPLIHPSMIDQLAEYLTRHAAVPMASLMTALKPEDLANPNVVKVVTDRDGFALYFSRAPIPHVRNHSITQSLNHPWKHLGIYGYQRHFLLQFPSLEPTPLEQAEQLEQLRALEHGYRIKLLETAHDTIGVDTPEDLKKAEALMQTVDRKPQTAARKTAGAVLVAFLLVHGMAQAANESAQDPSWRQADAQAMQLYQQGKVAEATALTESLLRRASAAFGPDDMTVAKYQNNLAQLDAAQHRDAEAALLYQRALHILDQRLGSEHPHNASVLVGYADVLKRLGRAEEANAIAARLQRIASQEHTEQANFERVVSTGDQLYAQGRFAEAEQVALMTVQATEKKFGLHDPRTALAYNDLATSYYSQRKFAEALPLFRKALDMLEQTVGERDADTITVMENYALCLRDSGDAKAAQPIEAQLKARKAKP
ncbi:MAG: 3-deoxy-manno-octulosonate cytidylyltransferase [Candidatus Omnitrophica bacterium]|nr:3-deoxy-manno-octulosonate cytidylyltransferase [Candidatus Omnitrophota bacterium]